MAKDNKGFMGYFRGMFSPGYAKQQQSFIDVGHIENAAAFGCVEKARHAKLAADNALPWGTRHYRTPYTLAGHAINEGVGPQGLSGFLGYPWLSGLWQNSLIMSPVLSWANSMTKDWIEITRNGKVDESDDDLKTLIEATHDHDLQNQMNEVVTYFKMFGGCMLFIDTGATDDELLTPLHISERSDELRRFKRFTLVEPINIFPGYYESTNPLSPSYFRPTTWWVLGKRIHTSRLIIFRNGGSLPILLRPAYNFFGVPHAQKIYDAAIHAHKDSINASRALGKFAALFFKTDFENAARQENGLETIKNRIGMMTDRTFESIIAIDNEREDIVPTSMPLGGITDIVRQSFERLVIANGSNVVETLGYSPAGFSTGESDERKWADKVRSAQEAELRKQIKKVLDILQVRHIGRINPEIDFEFVRIIQDNLIEEADYQQRQVNTIAAAVDSFLIEPEDARAAVVSYPKSMFADIVSEKPVDEDFSFGGMSNGLTRNKDKLGEIVEKLNKGEYTPEQALELIKVQFPISNEVAERLTQGSEEIDPAVFENGTEESETAAPVL